MNPKKIKKIVISSRVLRNNHLEGLFHTVPNSLIFVLHCRTVPSIEETNTRIILYEHTFFLGTRLLSPLIMGVSLEQRCPKGEVPLQYNSLMGMLHFQ